MQGGVTHRAHRIRRARAFGFAALAFLPLLSACSSVIPDAGGPRPGTTPPAIKPSPTPTSTGTPRPYTPRPSESGSVVAAKPIPATPNAPLAAPAPPATATTAAEAGVIAGPEYNELGVAADQATAALKAFRLSCPSLLRRADASGFARADDWIAGTGQAPSPAALRVFAPQAGATAPSQAIRALLDKALAGRELAEDEIVRLFDAQGADLHAVMAAADRLRRDTVGEAVTHVRNCNINYTNICQHRCGFCAFAKSHAASTLRGPAYRLEAEQVAARALEAWARGATEVCMQGGIHPHYTGDTYLELLAAVKRATPDMHIHAFSPLEIRHGAATLGLSLHDYLRRLRDAGLRTLPGTAAEILDDEVRTIICPDKLDSAQWLEVMEAAHEVGMRSTATIMFGHVDAPRHWARHLLAIRRLQAKTGGFTEFVPLPFVHMESPLWHKGRARSGPTLRESVLMHAVARLVLHPLIPNIQTSWVKMGAEGAALCLQAGANDLGGTLMYESITRAAGGANGQLMETADLRAIAARCERPLRQRTTFYETVPPAADGAAVGPPQRPRQVHRLHATA